MPHFIGSSSRRARIVIRTSSYTRNNGRNRVIYILPFFLAVVAIGFLLNFFLYQFLNFTENHFLQNSWFKFGNNKSTNATQEFIKVQDDNLFKSTTALDNEPKEFWEMPTLFNLNFTWARNNETICASRSNNSRGERIMPILVHTARSHFKERVIIRRTWGSLPIYKNWDIRFVFLLGETHPMHVNKSEERERLGLEQLQYGDLVQGNFVDTWDNLTYKHLMGYKWILNFCRDAKFVLKVDDDIFIDVMGFLDLRSEELNKLERNKSSVIPDLYCNTIHEGKPVRRFVSVSQWPGEFYPDYCSGWAYFITVDLIQKIYSVSTQIKFFWVDDVFITGSLMEVVQIFYKFKPKIRYIGGNFTHSDPAQPSYYCDSNDLNKPRKFGLVVNVLRLESFENEMMCMLNKTLYDSLIKLYNTEYFRDKHLNQSSL